MVQDTAGCSAAPCSAMESLLRDTGIECVFSDERLRPLVNRAVFCSWLTGDWAARENLWSVFYHSFRVSWDVWCQYLGLKMSQMLHVKFYLCKNPQFRDSSPQLCLAWILCMFNLKLCFHVALIKSWFTHDTLWSIFRIRTKSLDKTKHTAYFVFQW